MSRGFDFDDRDCDRNQEQEQPTKPGPQPAAYVGTRGGSSKPDRARTEHGPERDREVLPDARVNERLSFRAIERWYRLSERERGTLRESGVSAPSTPRRCPNTAMPESLRHSVTKSAAYRNRDCSKDDPFRPARIATRSSLWLSARKPPSSSGRTPSYWRIRLSMPGSSNRLKSRTMRRSIRCIKPKPKKSKPKAAESDALFWTTN